MLQYHLRSVPHSHAGAGNELTLPMQPPPTYGLLPPGAQANYAISNSQFGTTFGSNQPLLPPHHPFAPPSLGLNPPNAQQFVAPSTSATSFSQLGGSNPLLLNSAFGGANPPVVQMLNAAPNSLNAQFGQQPSFNPQLPSYGSQQ